MSDLEEMLRAASREPQPEGPPPGGFAELQRRLGRSPATGMPWGYLGLSLLVVLVGVLYWGLPAAAKPGTPTGSPDSSAPALYRDPAPTPTPAPTMDSRSVAASAPSRTAGSQPNLSSDASPAVAGIHGRPVVPKSSEPLASGIDAPQPDSRPAVPPPLSPLPKLPLDPIASQFAVTLPAIVVQQRIQARLAPRWDLRFNFYPNPAKQRKIVDLYSDEPPGGSSWPTEFVTDGNLRLLHWTGQLNAIGRYVQPIGQLQIARLTSSGMTYGLGATYYRQGPYPDQMVRRHAGDGIHRYVAYTDEDFRIWLLAANVGYTFPTASRWVPWIHGGLQFAVRSRDWEESRLLDGEGTATWPQSTTTTIDYPAFGEATWVVPNLEAGILYRLSGHWLAGASIGAAPGDFADIQPTLGAEVRYRW